jgi:hypothetical protein
MTTTWKQFLNKNKGKGMGVSEIGEKYCKTLLSEKIQKNIKEGVYTSRKQAIAVAYNQVKKTSPACKRYFS